MDKVQVWRVTDEKYADSAFSGEGARLWGGRFNSPGIPAVYTSGSLSLALLEILVQTNDRSNLQKKVLFRADIPDTLIETPSQDDLPEKWDYIPSSKASQNYGDQWIKDETSPVLRIPSVVVPQEFNYVVNPLHSRFNEINISDVKPLPLDPRFFGDIG
jgi:RES domain-containing protein